MYQVPTKEQHFQTPVVEKVGKGWWICVHWCFRFVHRADRKKFCCRTQRRKGTEPTKGKFISSEGTIEWLNRVRALRKLPQSWNLCSVTIPGRSCWKPGEVCCVALCCAFISPTVSPSQTEIKVLPSRKWNIKKAESAKKIQELHLLAGYGTAEILINYKMIRQHTLQSK